ncbi:chitin deacetylase [Puccinia graminis f. sp. tritici]|uniref:chitin deacetylase n=1 Tax=Puccinia graminis f. sp. tritici TaxID=56615 RepID=A0A5B0SFH2_PUCGR|nr:chitin deacetylase [Puccinia graminis f. sp. tritici]KAA1135983.1 chitin deacetylase [Puccinia graminis f. sp. tritici]
MAPSLLRTLVVISLTTSPFLSKAQTGGATASGGDPTLSLTPLPLSKTYPAGTQSPIPGAPPLPAVSIDISQYPPLDKLAPTDSDVVKAWLAKIDMTKVPAIKPNGLNLCANTTVNADAIAKAGPDGNCWWSCAGCTRSTDITTCPSKGTLGASFDDGPSEFTPNVLQYLDENKLKATFFIVGSRAVSSPDILRAEYMAGHQLCLHTWSHPSLTTITNEQIVAEFAWSMKAFKDILGIQPTCARPPYSDVDDRVRYILNAMGLKTILWTRTSTTNFDTNDWRVVAGSATAASSVQTFQGFLTTQSTLQTGFIVLAHDLFSQTVALSLKYFLPAALKTPGMKVQSISDCLGQPVSASYFETAGASGAGGATTPAGNSSIGTNGAAKAGSNSSGSATNQPGSPPKTPKDSGASRTKISLCQSALLLTIVLILV